MVRVSRVARDALTAIENGETADLELLEDVMRYVATYPDVHHHPNEDVVFRKLSDRAPHLRSKISDMLEQHESIIAKGQAFLRLIESIEEDSMVERGHFIAAGRAYLKALDEHMSIEERELFPAARQFLNGEDWDGVERSINRKADPLFDNSMDRDYGRLRQRIEAHTGSRAD